MTKEDFQIFLVDLIMIDDEKKLADKITSLYNISYENGGDTSEKEVFGRIYGLIANADTFVREFYMDACEHYGITSSDDIVKDEDDIVVGKLVGNNKKLILGDNADRVTKKITLNVLNKIRRLLRETLKPLRIEKAEIGLYDAFSNIPFNEKEILERQENKAVSKSESCEDGINKEVPLEDYIKFSDIFYDPLDEIRCVDALRMIRSDKPLIGEVSDRWSKRSGGKAILAAWIYRMEECGIIHTIRPVTKLIPLLERRFPGLKLGKCGRTLSDPDYLIANKFATLVLR